MIVIVVLSFLLLMIVIRSLLVRLFATIGYLFSVGAAFGASVAIFQWGWLEPLISAPQCDPMLSILPLIRLAFCSALQWITRCSSSRGSARSTPRA